MSLIIKRIIIQPLFKRNSGNIALRMKARMVSDFVENFLIVFFQLKQQLNPLLLEFIFS